MPTRRGYLRCLFTGRERILREVSKVLNNSFSTVILRNLAKEPKRTWVPGVAYRM